MNEPVIYRHVQDGKFVRALMFGIACLEMVPAIWLLFTPGYAADRGMGIAILLSVAAVLIVAGAMFSTMTIEVTANEVRWSMGVGWPRGRMLRAEMLAPTVETPGLWNGVGIHLTWRGWLWNVAPGKAVALHRRGGGNVLLGTDDPDGLMRALATP